MPDLANGVVWYFVFIFSTVLHEAAHAYAALRLGDDTAFRGGQVTLDPIPHQYFPHNCCLSAGIDGGGCQSSEYLFFTEFDFILVQLAAASAAGWQRCGSVVNGQRKRLEVHGICPPACAWIYRNYSSLEPFRLYF